LGEWNDVYDHRPPRPRSMWVSAPTGSPRLRWRSSR
jgi:hypothetical protein